MINPDNKKKAFGVIILFGLVSLCADFVYEAGRSINGPYLKVLAANAAIVGLVAGVGEFLGYALRLVSGYLSDKTRSYWLFTFLGYGLVIFVPLLSAANFWQMAAVFILAERIGKALRSPARDTILSSASKQVGTGLGFGLHEAMDQIGAIAGPLLLAGFFMFIKDGRTEIAKYQSGYALLWVPFFMLIACLAVAYFRLPRPESLEASVKEEDGKKLSRAFWLYTIFMFISTLGFANFILISYHFKNASIISDSQIPLFYAVAMGVDAAVALAIGKFYDILKARSKSEKAGLNALVIIPPLTMAIPILAFSRNFVLCLIGVFVWGAVMASHETIMRSAIADITPLKRRGTGYGIFNTGYGLSLFLGSAVMGLLYTYSITLLIIMTVVVELIALGVFIRLKKEAV